MLIGQLISLGPVIPADFPALFRWGNDVDSARLNEVYRPSDWNSHQEWWSNIGKDPSKDVFAIRKQGSNNILGFVQVLGINGLHQSAHLGVRIGEPADRGHRLRQRGRISGDQLLLEPSQPRSNWVDRFQDQRTGTPALFKPGLRNRRYDAPSILYRWRMGRCRADEHVASITRQSTATRSLRITAVRRNRKAEVSSKTATSR
jgi:hypothetical protein